ncbi:MAG: hypothetical protein ACE5K1_05540 [Acidiferrobacterales bacterium]
MRLSAIAFVVVAFTLAANATHPQRPLKPVSKLIVNTTNTERTIASDKCELEGIQDIIELMKHSSYEEMWVYLPKTCQWIEIGINEKAGDEAASVNIDRAFLTQVLIQSSLADLYHFHPLAYFRKCSEAALCGSRSLTRDELISNLRYAMPSPEDIYFMMDITWQFDQVQSAHGRMRHRVVTPYGIVEFALTETGKEKFALDRDLRTAGLYIKLVAANALVDDNIESIVGDHPNASEALASLVENLNSTHLRVTHAPLPPTP